MKYCYFYRGGLILLCPVENVTVMSPSAQFHSFLVQPGRTLSFCVAFLYTKVGPSAFPRETGACLPSQVWSFLPNRNWFSLHSGVVGSPGQRKKQMFLETREKGGGASSRPPDLESWGKCRHLKAPGPQQDDISPSISNPVTHQNPQHPEAHDV